MQICWCISAPPWTKKACASVRWSICSPKNLGAAPANPHRARFKIQVPGTRNRTRAVCREVRPIQAQVPEVPEQYKVLPVAYTPQTNAVPRELLVPTVPNCRRSRIVYK